MTAIIGPLETLRQARDAPAVRATYDAAHASTRRGVLGERNAAMLDEACRAAGVRRGAYDYRILAWLAGWEPETCVVVAGLIQRAYLAGLGERADRALATDMAGDGDDEWNQP